MKTQQFITQYLGYFPSQLEKDILDKYGETGKNIHHIPRGGRHVGRIRKIRRNYETD